MKKNRIGNTDIKATHLSFGAIKLHNDMPDKAENIVNRALDLGFNYIDTARCYGNSEELVGAVMKTRRSECYLSSKSIRRSKEETAEDVDISLKNLNTDMIDLYFCHDISRDANYEQVMSDSGIEYFSRTDQQAGYYYCEGKVPLSILFDNEQTDGGEMPFNMGVIDNDLEAFIYLRTWTYDRDPKYWGVLQFRRF